MTEPLNLTNISTEDIVNRVFKGSDKIDKGGYGSIYQIDQKWCVKVVRYHKDKLYKSPENPDRPENAEIRMLDLLCKEFGPSVPHIMMYKYSDTFVRNGRYHRLFLVPFVPNCDLEEFIENKIDDMIYEIEKTSNNEANEDGSDSEKEMTEDEKKLLASKLNLMFKVIFFQILIFLAKIQEKYPNFRHNDLKPNNVLVYSLKDKTSDHYYNLNGHKYTVPNIGIRLRVWDYDFSIIDGKILNEKVMSNYLAYIGVRHTQNRYYDLHTFINTLLTDNNFDLDKDTNDFVNYAIPKKYQGEKSTYIEDCRLLPDIEYTTPLQLLEHPYFNDFRDKALELVRISEKRQSPENVKVAHLIKDPMIRNYYVWLRKMIRNNIINATESQQNQILLKTAETYKDYSKKSNIKGHELFFIILMRVELAITKINQLEFEHFVSSSVMQGASEMRILDLHKKISSDLAKNYGI